MIHRMIRRRSVHTGLLLMAMLTLSACNVSTVDGRLSLGGNPENYFDSSVGTDPVQAMIGPGPEFSFDQQVVAGPNAPDLKIVADLAVDEQMDTMTVSISMTSTHQVSSHISGFEITLDNFSWESDGIGIAGVTEDSDDFPGNGPDGVEASSSPNSLVFTWPTSFVDFPFQHEALYTVALQ